MTESSPEPKVSVVVAAHNNEPHIRAALQGALSQQTTFSFEVIVGDDASTDGTKGIIEEFAARFPARVRALFRSENAGDDGLTTFTACVRSCRGQYIATLRGDDYWVDPSKLQRQAEILDVRPDCHICVHACRNERNGNPPVAAASRKPAITESDLLASATFPASSLMVRRKVAQEIMHAWPDLLSDWFAGVVASLEGPVAYIDRAMSVYRQESGGALSAQIDGVLNDTRRPELRKAICSHAYLSSLQHERAGDIKGARTLLARALKSEPAWLEPYGVCYALTGEEVLRNSEQRLRLYRYPLLFALRSMIERFVATARWRWLQATVQLRSHMRISRGGAFGYLYVSPDPARSSIKNPGLAAVKFAWTASSSAVEVRLAGPDGPLVSRTSFSGETTTGEWVGDGTVFYLQDVDGGLPLTRRNTLGVVRVRVVS